MNLLQSSNNFHPTPRQIQLSLFLFMWTDLLLDISKASGYCEKWNLKLTVAFADNSFRQQLYQILLNHIDEKDKHTT